MTKSNGARGSASKRCPECGVEVRAGAKYCDFCGRKVHVEREVTPPGKGRRSWAVVGAIAAVAAGFLIYAGNQFGAKTELAAPAPTGTDGQRQAVAVCEGSIRQQARAPFRVIAFRSTLIAEEKAGYVISGSVELQSAVGELQRRRYFCRVRTDPRSGLILDEGRID